MIHAMIDLETLSTNPNATILTVGGVKFDPYTTVEPAQGMYFRVDVDSQTEMGRDVMQDTLDWWGKQDPEIMDEALGDKDRISLEAMIKTINKCKHEQASSLSHGNLHERVVDTFLGLLLCSRPCWRPMCVS